jgi:hypothetical protein
VEFRLNKVDPEVRQRVKETTSANKIHNKREIFVNSDSKDKEKKKQGNFETELIKYKQGKNKKKIMIQATKTEEVEIRAIKEEGQILSKDDKKGTILDVKK